VLAIRPEAIVAVRDDAHPDRDNRINGIVDHFEFSGATTTLTVDANGLKIEVLVLRDANMNIGDRVTISLPSDQITLLSE
jgi:ABC-type Fe3+/spermidine/putrescine transport system ATPase subunit